MKIETPCPACGQKPTEGLDLRDGEIWLCLDCGYPEVGAGADVEAQLVALPRWIRGWRRAGERSWNCRRILDM